MNGKAAEQEDVTGTNGPFCRAGDSTRSTLRCPGVPRAILLSASPCPVPRGADLGLSSCPQAVRSERGQCPRPRSSLRRRRRARGRQGC